MLILALTQAFAALPAGFVLVSLKGMDDCCAAQVATKLGNLPGVTSAATDHQTGQACIATSAAIEPSVIAGAINGGEFTFVSAESVAACPASMQTKREDPWAGATGLDVSIISHGETVDFSKHAAAGKFTVYDFGAPWCEPCYTTADQLKAYLAKNGDTAVRAIVLDGGDPKQSFALPVVKQHLEFAAGLPWLKVMDASGKKVYEGNEVTAAIAAIDKRRSGK